MMRVNSADAAEVMTCGVGVELIEMQHVLSFFNVKRIERHGGHDDSFHSTQRTVATVRIDDAVRQLHLDNHGFAMAMKQMQRFYVRVADSFDH